VTIDLKDDKATAGDKDAIEKTDGDSRFKRALNDQRKSRLLQRQ